MQPFRPTEVRHQNAAHSRIIRLRNPVCRLLRPLNSRSAHCSHRIFANLWFAGPNGRAAGWTAAIMTGGNKAAVVIRRLRGRRSNRTAAAAAATHAANVRVLCRRLRQPARHAPTRQDSFCFCPIVFFLSLLCTDDTDRFLVKY